MSNRITTPIGTAVYPHVNKPDTKYNAAGEYNCKLKLDESDALVLKEQLETIYEEGYQDECRRRRKQSLRKAPRLPLYQDDDGDWLLIAKQKAKVRDFEFTVPLFDSAGKPTDVNVGSGSRLKLAIEPFPYYTDSAGYGLTLRLRGVQVIEVKEYASSSPFEAVEGGFVGEDLSAAFTEDVDSARTSSDVNTDF